MLLEENRREEFLRNLSCVCQEEGFGQSTWTIDLCYLLKRYKIQHCMYTTMIGVNEDYRRQGYYNKIINMGPVITLVDAGLLVCDLCKHNKLKAEFRRCFGGGYTGHYVLLVGYNIRNNKILYRDPALPARLCAVSPFRLKQARLATGTDEDVIFVFNNYR
ncbi:hypothetical protein K1T71_011551 [Dendrolimus kikuchii]|uniref:Uncharacterized protein n=1 Tax=Dendrolimus kikuchii TaxID=765133 RepID=A0ACC1CP46_9NEOP|nr:hypothetical protein K1T71_011551 [Dendrolimus kikuchii]